jgi:alkanesulfonate monooxygenase SsuD/methylene tetrahydromethanopterin reductase-like flavin-dependent oxidoreductase (luciferase family)
MLRAVARYADAWNAAWFSDPDDPALLERIRVLDEACVANGRDRSTLARTIGIREPLAAGEDLARSLAGFAARGFEQAIVWLDPMSGTSVERLATAIRQAGIGQ